MSFHAYGQDSEDDLELFRDAYLPVNYDSEDAEFYALLRSVPKIDTPNQNTAILRQNSFSQNSSLDQNIDLSVMEKLATCRKFGGYPHENASIFLTEFTSFATLHRIDERDDPRIIAAFHLNLTGPALTWFNSLNVDDKRSWQDVQDIFRRKYIVLDSQSPTVFLESEVFQNSKLKPGQPLEDFYGHLVEKAQILQKPDHEILSQFIKGLPDKLAFFVRAGAHKDVASALSAAKMGEAYGYRCDDLQVATIKQTTSTSSTAKQTEDLKSSIINELKTPLDNLAKAVADLSLQPQQKPRYNNRQRSNMPKQSRPNEFYGGFPNTQKQSRPHEFNSGFPKANFPSGQSRNTCFRCGGANHYRNVCNFNGQGQSDPSVCCQLCYQYGHSAIQCTTLTLSGNLQPPGSTRHDPSGGHK